MRFFLVLFVLYGSLIPAQTPPIATQDSAQAGKQNNIGNLPTLSPQQIKALKEVNELSVTVNKFYSNKAYDEALTVAEKAKQLAETNMLFDVGRGATVLFNLAEIYLVKGREGDAINLFEEAVAVCEKAGDKLSQARTLERLADLQSTGGSTGKAEKNLLKALELRENVKDGRSAEVVNTLLKIGKLYNYVGKPEKSETFYQRAVEVSDKVYKPEDKQFNIAFNRYQCWAYQTKGYEAGDKYISEYAKQSNSNHSNLIPKERLIQTNIVNGKAIKLARPSYPSEAKAIHAGGVVLVQVTIDEKGKVIKAETTCGYDVFAREAERSALESKFSPTLINGQPATVTGVIVYNFVAR